MIKRTDKWSAKTTIYSTERVVEYNRVNFLQSLKNIGSRILKYSFLCGPWNDPWKFHVLLGLDRGAEKKQRTAFGFWYGIYTWAKNKRCWKNRIRWDGRVFTHIRVFYKASRFRFLGGILKLFLFPKFSLYRFTAFVPFASVLLGKGTW